MLVRFYLYDILTDLKIKYFKNKIYFRGIFVYKFKKIKLSARYIFRDYIYPEFFNHTA